MWEDRYMVSSREGSTFNTLENHYRSLTDTVNSHIMRLCIASLKGTASSIWEDKQREGKGNSDLIYLGGCTGIHILNPYIWDVYDTTAEGVARLVIASVNIIPCYSESTDMCWQDRPVRWTQRWSYTMLPACTWYGPYPLTRLRIRKWNRSASSITNHPVRPSAGKERTDNARQGNGRTDCGGQ